MRTQSEENTPPEVINPTDARQGRKSFVLRILAISMALTVVAFAITYFIAETTDRDQSEAPSSGAAISETELPANVDPTD